MDPSALKVTELKAELKKRGLAVGGLKKDLVERLTEAIERENAEAAEEEEPEEEPEEEEEEEDQEEAVAVEEDKEEEGSEDATVEKLEEKVEVTVVPDDETEAIPEKEKDEDTAEKGEEGTAEPEKIEEPEKMDEDVKHEDSKEVPQEDTKPGDKDEPDTSASTVQTTSASTVEAENPSEDSMEGVQVAIEVGETKEPEAAPEEPMEVEQPADKSHVPTVETAAATPIPAHEEPKQPENVLEPITSAPTPLQPPEAVQSIEADLQKRRKRSRSPSVRADEVEAKKARIHDETVDRDEVAMSDAPVISTESPERGRKSPRDRSRTRSRSRSRTESPSQNRQRPSIAASTKDARFKSLFNKEEGSAANQQSTGAATPPRSDDEDETSPSIHPATRGLYIRELVRPLQESQLRTHLIQLASKATDPSSADPSTLERIYLDGIKTHCFAIFSTVQACSRARNGVHGKVFPNEKNRKVLFADYVPEDKIDTWISQEKDNRGVRYVITYGDGEDGVEAIHEECSSGGGGPGGRGSISGPRGSIGGGSGAPVDAPAGPRGRGSFSNNGPSSNTFTTGANAVPTGARVVSLDELFLSTKTKPKIYYKPVDEATVKARIAKGPVEGEVRGRRMGGRSGDVGGSGAPGGNGGSGNPDSWRGGFGGGGRGGRGGRRGGGDSWTNKDRDRERDFERRDWVRDGGRGDRRGPFRERSPRERW
ncbi:hypothetical protein TWF730_003162 [Orbilia blumenaviensis]|uniref:SAP domain-containing protein n=1 Tax=Orbilia blumenaviensis TaxID=1796055 RepID=A0AAV9U8X7_9PEZI